jgi:hypothetical protein
MADVQQGRRLEDRELQTFSRRKSPLLRRRVLKSTESLPAARFGPSLQKNVRSQRSFSETSLQNTRR